MNKARFKEHYSTEAGGVIVIPKSGVPRRLDGRPLSESEKSAVAGQGPLKSRKEKPATI